VCGRYELHSHPAAIALAFALARAPALVPRYNIAPMTDVAVVRANARGDRDLVRMRWGLVPRWARDPAIGARLINARGETMAVRPAFRMAFQRHRCLLPADGFYEWQTLPARGGRAPRKVPLHIGMKDGAPFAMAALAERWMSEHGDVLDTCAIVTTEANDAMRDVHDRMPLIVAPEHHARWLDRTRTDVADIVVPFPSERMARYPVSTRVNNVRHDDASLIEHDETAYADAAAVADSEPEQESLF
jgi:putative SOS response-associated peptidase YedK